MVENTGAAPGAPGGAPGGTPAGNTSGDTGGNFMRSRVEQLSRSMAEPADRPAMPPQTPPQPEINPRSRGHSPAMDQRQQQPQPPADQKIKIGAHERTEQEWNDLSARDAEAQIRRQGLPQSPDGYQAKLLPDWQPPADLPPGTRFEFNLNDPALAQLRAEAHASGLSQEQFSRVLGIYASTKIGEQQNIARVRANNLQQLGATGAQRIDAVSTWLRARAGTDGAAVADFISKYPSAQIVRAFEQIVRQFSNQGGVPYSQSHRETNTQPAGSIPGFDQMNFTQRRASQMIERMRTDPNYARGTAPDRR